MKDKIKVSGKFRALQNEKIIAESKNQICLAGLKQILFSGGDIPAVIAVGTGLSAVTSSDTKLENEVSNGRFGVTGNLASRYQEGSDSITIVNSAFWQSGQGYTGAINEVGLFVGQQGFPLSVKDTGFLVGRVLTTFTKVSAADVTLVYEITLTV